VARASCPCFASQHWRDASATLRLQRIKNYVFNNREWTYADPRIAEAWHRLRTGRGTPVDKLLLKHETAEMWYRRRILDEYRAAHQAANRHWNWQALIEALEYEL
jgi:hypothetical protein